MVSEDVNEIIDEINALKKEFNDKLERLEMKLLKLQSSKLEYEEIDSRKIINYEKKAEKIFKEGGISLDKMLMEKAYKNL